MNTTPQQATLYTLTYVSSAKTPFSTSDLIALLDTSRKNNQAAEITGMLLYKDGTFMQVLEGPEDAVRHAHVRIGRDSRHDGLITLLERPVKERQFGDWSMGFRNLTDPSLQSLLGYSEFLNTPLTSVEFTANPSRAQKLLLTFKGKM